MAVPAWPTGNFPFIDDPSNFRETGREDNVLRTPMDAGPVKTRRRFTAASSSMSGSTGLMTDAQVELFRTFFEDVIADGALRFTAPHPRTGVTRTFRIKNGYLVDYRFKDVNRIELMLEVLP